MRVSLGCFTYVCATERTRLVARLARLAARLARLEIAEIEKYFSNPCNRHILSVLRDFSRVSIYHSLSLFVTLYHSLSLCGSVKNKSSNFAIEIRRKPVLKSLARTCDVRPHIAFNGEIANARLSSNKLDSLSLNRVFASVEVRQKRKINLILTSKHQPLWQSTTKS